MLPPAAGNGTMGGSNEREPAQLVRTTPPKKLQARITKKRLPWLDGKSSLASPPIAETSPPARKASVTSKVAASPSLKGSPSIRSTVSMSPLSRHPTSDTESTNRSIRSPPARRQSTMPATERRISSTSASNPVTRAHASTISRASTVRSAPSPSREIASRRLSAVAHEPKKRLSIVPAEEPGDPFEQTRPRAESLAPVPGHLERVETPDSVIRPVQRNAYMASKSIQMSPTQPVPKPSTFERVSSRRLSNAIEGLEDLVQEAAVTAEDTSDPRQMEEIYEIIEDARNAVQEATNDPAPHLMRTSSPLEASGSSEEVTDFSSESSESSGSPSFVAPVQNNNLGDPESSPSAKARNAERKGSEAIDWAYRNANNQVKDIATTSPSSSDREDSRGRSRFSSRSDLRLLPPDPVQTAPRDHVDFVLRPTRDHSRGRSRRRRTSGSELGARRRRHRRSWRSDTDRSRSSRRRSRRRQRSSGLGSLDASFDEEDLSAAGKPNGIKRYGTELHVRDQAHHHTFSLRRHHRRQPIARNWRTSKKRLTAAIACINTALLGIIVGIYAGEVPRIQYMLADERHHVIIGNAVLYAGLAISTFISWPLPLLHGRKPYILAALALAMPLQFPQALVVSAKRSPKKAAFRTGLLVSRAFSGVALGFANINFISILFDLFGASLQSKHPHQEFTVPSDVRKHGGGMGMWLGIWSWCSIGSLAVGFQIGAAIIKSLTPDWGFYICIMILAFALVLNVMAPETRRSAYRRSVTEVYDRDENYITRRVARGEIKLHISTEGPKYWFEEVWAGMKLSTMMLCQPGFLVLSFYLGWIYAQVVLVIVLLGALLSRDYKWQPEYVGLGVLSIAIGAFLAIPLTKAGIFSRERKKGFRTDSMTFQKQVSWSSHLVRRILFTLTLPLMGIAYTISSAGRPKPYMVPIVFAGAVGFLSILAIAECHGLIMETFDTCDLQPGVNTRHRLQSMAVQDRRRRTNYSSFPRVSAGIFVAQTLSYIGAAIATLVGGIMTRRIGAQASTGVTAGILLFLTILLTLVLWRFQSVQVIPNHTFGTRRDTAAWNEFKELEAKGRGGDWKAVVIGNPSGKMRRISVLELGSLSRWTEIRKLNFLIGGAERRKRDDWHQGGSW